MKERDEWKFQLGISLALTFHAFLLASALLLRMSTSKHGATFPSTVGLVSAFAALGALVYALRQYGLWSAIAVWTLQFLLLILFAHLPIAVHGAFAAVSLLGGVCLLDKAIFSRHPII